MNNEDKGQIVLFQTEDGHTKLEVQLQDETVWLTIDQMAELFQRNRSTISRHIKRIYDDGELSKDTTCAKFACVVNRGIRGMLLDVKNDRVERTISTTNTDKFDQAISAFANDPLLIHSYID
ncbi:MAG: hypothetical protein ACI3YI_12545 [Bacteroidaceae bacterium]